MMDNIGCIIENKIIHYHICSYYVVICYIHYLDYILLTYFKSNSCYFPGFPPTFEYIGILGNVHCVVDDHLRFHG